MGEMVVGWASSMGGGAPYMSWGLVTKKQPPEDYKALLFYVEQILDRKLTQEETTIILALAGGENHVPEK